jgi:hypothetical protein
MCLLPEPDELWASIQATDARHLDGMPAEVENPAAS